MSPQTTGSDYITESGHHEEPPQEPRHNPFVLVYDGILPTGPDELDYFTAAMREEQDIWLNPNWRPTA